MAGKAAVVKTAAEDTAPQSKTTAATKAAAKAAAKPKSPGAKAGRRPNEWVTLFVNGAPFGEVGVYPSKKKATVKLWVGPKAVEAAAEKAEEPAEDETASGEKKGGKKEAAPAAVPAVQFLQVKEGKSTQIFSLDAEQLADFQSYEAALDENRGIFINSFAPGNTVDLYTHENVFWLTPREDVAYTLPAYRVLQENLFAQHLVGFGHYVSGKGFNYVALAAVEEGLVLLQLPLRGETHAIDDAIDTKWRSAQVSNRERELMSSLIRRMLKKRVALDDLDHPMDAYLRQIVEGKRVEGELPEHGSTNQFPNLEAVLAAAAQPAKRRKTRQKT